MGCPPCQRVARFGPSVRFGCKGNYASTMAAPRLLIGSHSGIDNTEANLQHPVGPKTIRSPVDISFFLSVAYEPPG